MSDTTSLYRYFHKDGVLLYVGISKNWLSRLIQHESDKHWIDIVTTNTIEKFIDRDSALLAEFRAIRDENPIHNKQCFDPRLAVSSPTYQDHVSWMVDIRVGVIISQMEKLNLEVDKVVADLLRWFEENNCRMPDYVNGYDLKWNGSVEKEKTNIPVNSDARERISRLKRLYRVGSILAVLLLMYKQNGYRVPKSEIIQPTR